MYGCPRLSAHFWTWLFRDPRARSSALAALGTLQPRALGSLNRVDPLDSVSNYYVCTSGRQRVDRLTSSSGCQGDVQFSN